MKFSLDSLNDIYFCAEKLVNEKIQIEFTPLWQFNKELKLFINKNYLLKQDEYWRRIFSKLKKFSFEVSIIPLNQDYLIKELKVLIEYLIINQPKIQIAYPQISTDFDRIIKVLNSLMNLEIDILFKKCLEEISNSVANKIAVLIAEARYIQQLENQLKNKFPHKEIHVISKNSYKGIETYECIFVFGSNHFYGPAIQSSPHSPKLIWVNYSWIPVITKRQLFFESMAADYQSTENTVKPTFDEVLELSDLKFVFPELDESYVFEKINSNRSDDEHEVVDALGFFLQDGWFVFLENDDSKALTVELEISGSKLLLRKRIKELEPGDYLLLRIGGGGDFVKPMADKILGNKSVELRKHQALWKDQLRSRVKTFGYQNTVQKLLENGSTVANIVNLSHWLNPRGIKPQMKADFLAILKLIRMEDQFENYWKWMKLIEKAHIVAGQDIRKLLLHEVQTKNLDDLKKTGKKDFSLQGMENIKITAFQIIKKLDNSQKVSSSLINEPFLLEG